MADGELTPGSIVHTDELERGLKTERDYTNLKFEVVEEHIRGIDKATSLLNDQVLQGPTALQQAIERVNELVNEKFRSIESQFEKVEASRKEQKVDAKIAIDAALSAVGESNREQTTEQRRAGSIALTQIEERFQETRREGEIKYRGIELQLQELAALKASELVQIERSESLRRESAEIRASSDRAINKSEAATEKRFESLNDFRGQLTDQASRFMPREVADTQIGELKKQLATLTQRIDVSQGSSVGAKDKTASLYAFIGVTSAFLGIIVLLSNGIFK